MATPERDLVAAIESTLHFYPPVPGLSADLGVPGVHGRITSVSHSLANLVGMAHLTDGNADAVIARVRERYASEGKAFGWVTGPSTTPADLSVRLVRAGMRRHDPPESGMALTDLAVPIDANPDVRIDEIAPAAAERHAEMMGRAYGMPTEVATFVVRLLAAKSPIRTRGYLAYLGGAEPVAWSYLVYIPGTRIVLLGGAATLAEFRGRGIYTALVKRRLDDARADGNEAAVIQAGHLSAPVCAKIGFRTLCELVFHTWPPEADA